MVTVFCVPLPFVSDEDRIQFRTIDSALGLYKVTVCYGFAERQVDTMHAIVKARKRGLRHKEGDPVSFFTCRSSIVSHPAKGRLHALYVAFYEIMSRNSSNFVYSYKLPAKDTMEVCSKH
ncbi:hypothetical protein BKA69DRAFT_817614 [Paraphysoderma sedebokerense]|nr:hypothetical protein BKA69DRAFT_817614 [Paraphysoderma sedebokerense]